jgi:RHS repeat-associated protein
MKHFLNGLLFFICIFGSVVSGAQSFDRTKYIASVNGRLISYEEIKAARSQKSSFPNLDFEVGNIPLGQEAYGFHIVWGYPICSVLEDEPNCISQVVMSGSTDFQKTMDYCTGYEWGPLQHYCEVRGTFTPSSIGKKVAYVDLVYYRGSVLEDQVRLTFRGSSYKLPLDCRNTKVGSIIDVDARSLGEKVPIVGTDMSLFYSSAYSPEYSSDSAEFEPAHSFNYEGWTNSLHHLYIPLQRRLFRGDGHIQHVEYLRRADGNYIVPNPDGSEVYIFTPSGKHLETRTPLTNSLKYTFAYDLGGRLVSIEDAFGNTTTFTRNSSGKLTQITAPKGQVTSLNLNSNGLVSTVTNPNGDQYSLTYKTGTQLLETFTRPGGQVSTFTYNSSGHLLKDLGNGGDFWELMVGLSGETVISSQMGRGNSSASTFDSYGSHTRTLTSSFGGVSSHTQSWYGGVWSSDPIESSSVNSVADERFGTALWRTSSTSHQIGSTSLVTTFGQTVTYPTGVTPDPFNFETLTKTQTKNGKTFVTAYDSTTKTLSYTSPLGATRTEQLDAFGRPSTVQIGADTATSFTYNLDGKIQSSVQGVANNQISYSYNSAGFLQSITNALSEVTSYVYDLAGRVTSVTLPDLRVIQYGYDLNGNITSVTPPSRPVHNFTFNAMELMSEYQPPTLSGVLNVNTQYAYNMDKQLTQITRPNGDVANFNYNATTGLLSSLSWSGGTRTFSYHPNTDLVSRVDMTEGNRSNYTYYGRNIATEEQRWISGDWLFGKVINTYDNEHRFSGRTVQGNSATNYSSYTINYNNDDKPSRIGFVYYNYEYPSGRLSSTTMDTVSDSYTYDTYGNLSGYSATYTPSGSGTPQLLYSYTLTRDAINRITGKSETIQGVSSTYSYSYDNVGRLTGVIKDGLPYSSYTYDSNSNRISGMTGGVTFTATYDNQDRLITYGSKNYTYNSNGDLSHIVYSDATSHEFWFDAFGNIQYIKRRDGSWETYYADGKNRLMAGYLGTSLMHRRIYQDDYRIAARLNDSGVMSENYVYGSHISTPEYVSKGGYRQRVIRDHLGSPRLVVRTLDGVVSQRMDYNEFGEVINDTNPGYQPYGFAGGIYFPSTKMVKFGARFYDASVGRWLSKDPILFGGGDTNLYGYTGAIGKVPRMETNLYGYVLQDPINYIDPTGLYSEEYKARGAKFAGAGVVIGAVAGVCTSAGLGTAGLAFAGGVLGYAIGVAPGVVQDINDIFNGTPAPDNMFNQ